MQNRIPYKISGGTSFFSRAEIKDMMAYLDVYKRQEYALVSGTHVAADIDLASKNVTGNLYNVWKKENTALQVDELNHELVKFNGTLANDGSIAGTATATAIKGNPEGVLKASLYGDKAQELGGLVASKDTTNNWGAAFGAKVQNNLYKAPDVYKRQGQSNLWRTGCRSAAPSF